MMMPEAKIQIERFDGINLQKEIKVLTVFCEHKKHSQFLHIFTEVTKENVSQMLQTH